MKEGEKVRKVEREIGDGEENREIVDSTN